MSGIYHQLSCPYTPTEKVALNESIVIWLKLIWPSSSILIFLLASELTFLALQLASWTSCCPLKFLELSPISNFFVALPPNFSYKDFYCLDPTTTKLYIMCHAQFDESHFPSLDTSLAQPLSTLHIFNFMEPCVLHTYLPPLLCLIFELSSI